MADSSNIWAATIPDDGAAILVAPLGTTEPTTADEVLDAAFLDLGWVSEDGVTITVNRDITRHKAWSGQTVKTTQDNYEQTVKFALLETSVNVLETVFGPDNVTEYNETVTVNHDDAMLGRQVFVVDFVDGDKKGRHLLREGLIVTLDDLNYKHSEMTMYSLEVDVYKPATGDTGVTTFYSNVSTTGS